MLGRPCRGRASIVAALYALAMLVFGFSHQPQQRMALKVADAAMLVLPDGSTAPVCGHEGQKLPDNGAGLHHCDACALSAAPGLPPAAGIGLPAPISRLVRLGLATTAQFSPGALSAPTSRGPPLA